MENKKTNGGFGASLLSLLKGRNLSSRRLPVKSVKLDRDVKVGFAKAVLMIVLPLVIIWSVRTLFNLDLPISFKNWFAAFLLIASLRLIFKDFDTFSRTALDDELEDEEEPEEEEGRIRPVMPREAAEEEEEPKVEDVIELREMVGPRDSDAALEELKEEIARIVPYRQFVPRKELVKELSRMVIALSQKDGAPGETVEESTHSDDE